MSPATAVRKAAQILKMQTALANVACALQRDDREVIVRGRHDCWVVARHRNGRELYLVMEGKGEIGLAGAAKLASNFADNHFLALF